MGTKEIARSAAGPNDARLPDVKDRAVGGLLPPGRSECRLRRPGHTVRPIDDWHRCIHHLVTVSALPSKKPTSKPFKQRFLLIARDQETGGALAVSHRFVVHDPDRLKAFLATVSGEVRYSPEHGSIWGNGLTCNAGFAPCFSKPYPCSEQLGEGWSEAYGRIAYREDSAYKDRRDIEGRPEF